MTQNDVFLCRSGAELRAAALVFDPILVFLWTRNPGMENGTVKPPVPRVTIPVTRPGAETMPRGGKEAADLRLWEHERQNLPWKLGRKREKCIAVLPCEVGPSVQTSPQLQLRYSCNSRLNFDSKLMGCLLFFSFFKS